MLPETLAVTIPIVAIAGCVAIAAIRALLAHREKIETMRTERAERQDQADRELLAGGGGEVSAHLEAILDRLTAMEGRLSRLEAEPGDERTMTPLAIPETDSGPRRERRQQDSQLH